MPDQNKTTPEIREEIKQAFPAVIQFAENNGSWKRLVEDYCAIGSLLTDHATCLKHLDSLEDALKSELRKQLAAHADEQRNQFWVGKPLSQFGRLDAVRVSSFVGNMARNTKRSFYETRTRMADQFEAMRVAIDNVVGGTRFDQYPGKQEGPADGRAVWRRNR